MKIIICGAGQVGRGIAGRLSAEGNDVTVIDRVPELVRIISDELDVQGIVGHGSHPDVLEQAGAPDADMLIAVTHADEVNMMACEVANALFNVPFKVARVRAQSYLQDRFRQLFTRDNTAVDLVISPELAVGGMVLRRLGYPGAQEVVPFAEERVLALGIRLDEDCPVLGTPINQLSELFPDLVAVVVAIRRDGRMVVPHLHDEMEAGDFVFVITEARSARRVLHIFGHEEPEAQNVVIAGAGNVGVHVARRVREQQPHGRLFLIEQDLERAERAADALGQGAVVLHGSALDTEILEEADIARADIFIALTNDDKVNLLSALLARQQGAARTLSLVASLNSAALAAPLGVDSWIDPRAVTVAEILQHVRRGRIIRIYPVFDSEGEILEAEALETSPVIGKKLREAELPEGVRFGVIVRGGEVIRATGDVEIRPGDRVVLFALAEQRDEVQRMFRVSLEYF